MRQFRPTITISFKYPNIKKETDGAYLFEFGNGLTQWIPKKWIKKIDKSKKKIIVKEYWMNEITLLGFEKYKKK